MQRNKRRSADQIERRRNATGLTKSHGTRPDRSKF